MTFQAPGLTTANILSLIASATSLDATNDATLIYQAVTVAGQVASTWRRRGWWWSRDYETFPTVNETASYNLRTVNTNAMQDLYAPIALWYDDSRRILPITKEEYDERIAIYGDSGSPEFYALAGDLTAYIYPTPDGAYTIDVSFVRRHSKIDASGGDLTVPQEFQYGVYVGGAVELLQGDHLHDPSFLLHSEKFKAVMLAMAEAEPQKFDPAWSDREGMALTVPPDTKVFTSAKGLTI